MTEEQALPVRGLSQMERLVDTFVAPSETFRDILRSAAWWLPFLLAVLATVAVTVTIDRKVGFDQVVETQVHLNPSQESQLNSLPPEDRGTQMHKMAVGYRYVSYGAPVLILAFAAFGSLILWATVTFALGSRATFTQILCLWMYANLPRLLSSLVTMVTLLFGGSPEGFDLKQPAGTNLGYYMTDAAPWLRTLLGFFDVVGLWTLVLLVLGTAIVAKIKTGQAAAVVVGWWLLVLVVSVAAAAAFS